MPDLNSLLFIAKAYAQSSLVPPSGFASGACDCIFQTSAQGESGGFRCSIPNAGFLCMADATRWVAYIIAGFTISIALVMLMVNGFRYMIGPAIPGGSSDAAKRGITAALMGVVVTLLTYAIVDTVITYITS